MEDSKDYISTEAACQLSLRRGFSFPLGTELSGFDDWPPIRPCVRESDNEQHKWLSMRIHAKSQNLPPLHPPTPLLYPPYPDNLWPLGTRPFTTRCTHTVKGTYTHIPLGIAHCWLLLIPSHRLKACCQTMQHFTSDLDGCQSVAHCFTLSRMQIVHILCIFWRIAALSVQP